MHTMKLCAHYEIVCKRILVWVWFPFSALEKRMTMLHISPEMSCNVGKICG